MIPVGTASTVRVEQQQTIEASPAPNDLAVMIGFLMSAFAAIGAILLGKRTAKRPSEGDEEWRRSSF